MSRTFQVRKSRAVLRLTHQLKTQAYPRMQMGLIVSITGLVGLLFSFLLLHAGIDSMAMRYPLALLGSYIIFLVLLWLWLRTTIDSYTDLHDFSDLLPSKCGAEQPLVTSGGDGDFGGGGATGSYDLPSSDNISDSTSGSTFSDVIGATADADEAALPILAIVLAAGLVFASFYVIYIAPMLFSEMLVDGALSYALYRRLRGIETEHWLTTALRRTVMPFIATAIFVFIVGAALGSLYPGAKSLGDVIHQSNQQSH